MLAGSLFVIGLAMFLSVPVAMFMAGVRSDEDATRWLLDKPLDFIVKARLLTKGGVGLIGASVLLYTLDTIRTLHHV